MSDEKQCPKCAETIKAAAVVCKHCGYNFEQQQVQLSAKKKRGCWFYILCFLGLGVVANGLVLVFNPDIKPTVPATPTLSADQVADQTRLKSAVAAAKAVKAALRDPDSLVVERIGTDDAGSLVCIEYRARNGFGGMNRSFVAFKDGSPKEEASYFNKSCPKAVFILTDRVNRRL
ncbi:zinc ribbon domain-containing protein [Novosphingobium sp. EMRT-2]|uniref:zinc ribbon domain-containing protein n=1 Tax=Novosphingobium sp. EMRT-2 TaxID=2571749 RepID=UPI0010BDE2D4|nr:zinc ribbon domain-containing protein [Novosphingobium sp. EMRT-2]QCI93375.1 zinc ribbon domain-containing protein [Novosphingobium sp. EMRT-2]